MEAGRLPREQEVLIDQDPTAARGEGWTPSDPGPLGLAAFATTTFALSLVNANLVTAKALPMVAMIALAFGGIAQLVAGIWEFRTGNTFGAVVFTAYGTFWISFFFVVQLALPKIPVADVGSTLGLYLWTWTIFTIYIFICSLRTTGAIVITLALLVITFVLLAIGNSALAGTMSATNGTIKLGGYVGIATAIAAWYTSFAGIITATFGRPLLPVFALNRPTADRDVGAASR
ncbi:MAG: acetate uptake transporter [Solirubrobacterales bacterium]|nr:acetate uptake transporter [Solirubrobacterales bacterium]